MVTIRERDVIMTLAADRLIYGCMRLGSNQPGTVTTKVIDRAEAAIDAALAIGIRTFDHADIYAHGSSEEVFGQVLARASDLRPRIRLQSKVGIRLPTDHAPGIYDLRPPSIRRGLMGSLERLGVDHLDVLLLHRPDPLMEPERVATEVADAQAQGLIRSLGASNMSISQLSRLASHLTMPLAVSQLEMSLSRRAWLEGGVLVNTPEATSVGFPEGTIEYCAANQIQLQAWGALAEGRFTGAERAEQDRRTSNCVQRLAEHHNTTPESIVLAWLQRHPAGIVPVIGTTNPTRIAACFDAAQGRIGITHEQWYELWLTARGVDLP